MFRLWQGSVVVLLLLTACATASAGPKIKIENAWARPAIASVMKGTGGTPEMGGMGGMSGSETTTAAYFVIVNEGSDGDTLVGATSDAVARAEMHETRIEGGVAKMMPVPRVDIPARGRVEFKPASFHMMLIGPVRDLKEGESLKLTLQFEKSGPITVEAAVSMR